MPNRCAKNGCERDATHYPGLLIPAKGYPPTPRSNCLESGLGIECCEEHAADPAFAKNVPDEIKSNVNDMLASIRRAPVDWKRATVEARPIGDSLWFSIKPPEGRA